jgi:hypothetical protein
MHFTKTIAAAFALTATVSSFPLQKRQNDAVIGNPNSVSLSAIPMPVLTHDFLIFATHLFDFLSLSSREN